MALTAIGPCLLGTAFLVTSHLPPAPVWIGAERVLPAGLVLVAAHPCRPRGAWWWRLAALGVCDFGLFFAIQAYAAQEVPGGIVSAITALQASAVIGATTLLGQRPTRRQVAATVVGAAGVAAVVLHGDHVAAPAGVAAALALPVLAAVGMVGTQRAGIPPGMTRLAGLGWQMVLGGALLVPVAAATEGDPPPLTATQFWLTVWLSLAATAVAFATYFGRLGQLPASLVALTGLLSPLAATGLGWLVAGQALSVPQLLGLAAVLSSLGLGYQAAPPPTGRSDATTPDRQQANTTTPTAPTASLTSQPVPSLAAVDGDRGEGTDHDYT